MGKRKSRYRMKNLKQFLLTLMLMTAVKLTLIIVTFVQMAGKVMSDAADFDVTIGALEAARYKPIFDRVDEIVMVN